MGNSSSNNNNNNNNNNDYVANEIINSNNNNYNVAKSVNEAQLMGSEISRIGPKDYNETSYAEKEVCALIITINNNSSYDSLYQTKPQFPPDPSQYISVYQMTYQALPHLEKVLKGEKVDLMEDITRDLERLDGENVVINFECCSGCNDSGFTILEGKFIINLIKQFIDLKFVVMFSDFSLKGLIHAWNNYDNCPLGPNPFVRERIDASGSLELQFLPNQLIDCEFSQLQNVGELCDKGVANVHAMSSTILYSINTKQPNSFYDIEILSLVTKYDQRNAPRKNVIGKLEGLAGHVALKFNNGGRILTSCGHWIELEKLDTSPETVFAHAEKYYGAEYSSKMRSDYANMKVEDQLEQCRVYANNAVQTSAPCKYKSKSFW